MGRPPKNRGEFRKKRMPRMRQRPNVVRFITRGKKKEQRKQTMLLAGGAFLASVVVGVASLWIWPADGGLTVNEPILGLLSSSDTNQPSMELCSDGQRYSCVVDGDTIWLEGEKIRIADIDTPEVSEPRCDSEYRLGMRATYRLRDLLNEGPWSVEPIGDRDTDDYGRSLRVLTRNGQSIGDMLVAEGLARTWTGRREPWC